MDSNAAWKGLKSWHNGKTVRLEVASAHQNCLHGASLIPESHLNDYTNAFMMNFDKLKSILCQVMSEEGAKDLFLSND